MSTTQAAPAETMPGGLTAEEIEMLNFNEDDARDDEIQPPAAQVAAPAVADPAAVVAVPAAVADPAANPDAVAAPAVVADAKPVDAASTPAAEPPAATPPAQVAPTSSAPLLVIEEPAEAKARIAAITDEKATLRKQFDDGDITFADYDAKKDALAHEELTLNLDIREANLARSLESQRRKNEWDGQCDTFFAANPVYQDQAKFEQFNDALKAIGSTPSGARLSGPEVLAKAHRFMQMEGVVPATAPAPAAAAQKEPPKPREPLPPTLHNLPSADSTDAGGGKWDAIDRLATTDMNAYEAKLATMSKAEYDAYMKQ